MLFTVDRLQFDEDKLIAFEFFDYDLERGNEEFNGNKVKYIKEHSFFDKYYGIGYDESKNTYEVKEIDLTKDIERSYTYTWEDYATWFNNVNNPGSFSRSFSKPLNSATKNVGDHYVQSLLNEIHTDEYPEVDFYRDDSGLGLTAHALNGTATYGFDFDLFEPTNNIVIEFLKRENPYVTNLTAHPARYTYNYRKFLSLWKAANHINGSLYLVNYSDDPKEAISVIKVIEMNDAGRIEHDIGYKLTNRKSLLRWLKRMNTDPTAADKYLTGKPKEIRDNDFWNDYMLGKEKNDDGSYKHSGQYKTIGKNYN